MAITHIVTCGVNIGRMPHSAFKVIKTVCEDTRHAEWGLMLLDQNRTIIAKMTGPADHLGMMFEIDDAGRETGRMFFEGHLYSADGKQEDVT